jgi:uracil-DNA glycosylase
MGFFRWARQMDQTTPTLTYLPCTTSEGRSPNELMLVGEAPGEEEERQGRPFVGASGQELRRLMSEAGLASDSYLTNVFRTRPPANDLTHFIMNSKSWLQAKLLHPSEPQLPPMRSGSSLMYLLPTFYPELKRLALEILECNPNLILCLGNTALWALTGHQNISAVRGAVATITPTAPVSLLLDGTPDVSVESLIGRKILPTFHPAAVLRQWDLRTIVLADLIKAKAQAVFPEIRRPERHIEIIERHQLDVLEHYAKFLGPGPLAVDVETRRGQITCIGFAQSPQYGVVVPFVSKLKDHYWATTQEECEALRLVRNILHHPCPKVFQNGLYDLHYIWRTWHIAPCNCRFDTMLRHHAEYPELQKSLGFMGSIYTNEASWKLMRAAGSKHDTAFKSDDD